MKKEGLIRLTQEVMAELGLNYEVFAVWQDPEISLRHTGGIPWNVRFTESIPDLRIILTDGYSEESVKQEIRSKLAGHQPPTGNPRQ